MSVEERDEFNPYRAPESEGTVRREPSPRRHLAGRVERMLAAILDSMLYVPAFFWLLMGNAAAFLSDSVTYQLDRAGTLGILLFLATCLVIFSLQSFLLALHGWTLGKRVLKLRVVAVDGRPASFVQLVILRSLLPGLAGFCCGMFSLIDALFIFGDERRCLHDLLAGTIVVNA